MSADAIGPGDFVVAVRPRNPRNVAQGAPNLTVGAIYQLERWVPARAHTDACDYCLGPGSIETFAVRGLRRFYDSEGQEVGFCPCAFRKWPPPPDEALRDEELSVLAPVREAPDAVQASAPAQQNALSPHELRERPPMTEEGRRLITLFGEMTGQVPSFPEPTRERFTDVDRRLSKMTTEDIEATLEADAWRKRNDAR